MTLCRLLGCLFALLALGIESHAQPLTYYVQNLPFADGGSGTGSFLFDSSSSIYSNVSITTTPGTIRTTGATYIVVCGQDVPACNTVHDNSFVKLLTSTAADQTGLSFLLLQFVPPLSPFGFAETVYVRAAEAGCGDAACNVGVTPDRILVTPGGVVGSSETLVQYLFFGS